VPTDLSFVYSVPQGHFSDKNADDPYGCWYPGKVTRDLTTGEVTWAWDRAADTISTIEKYNGIYRGSEKGKIIYLTFDCGYEYRPDDVSYPDGVTADILDTLKEKNAPGTFFVTGDYLNAEPGLVGRMLDEGHIVGNHTLSHPSPNMTSLTPERFVAEIKENNDLLKTIYPDAPDMVYYRPPEGGACEWTMAISYAMGLKTVFWSAIEPNDHVVTAQKDPSVVLQNNKQKLHNGAVYLIHAVSVSNAKMLGDFIDYARAEGYEIKGLDEFVG
jgi:peptidoglycan-N-acetylmuramic acid deacetylase